MSFYGGGDDALLRKLFSVVTVLTILAIILLLLAGLVQFKPFTKQDFSCTQRYHPLISTRYVQLEEPILPRSCRG